MNDSEKKNPPVFVTLHGGGRFGLDGLTRDEDAMLHASLSAGACWVRAKDGRIESIPSYLSAPEPGTDIDMERFWPTKAVEQRPVQMEMFDHPEKDDRDMHSSSSFIIQHLCGYNYTPEKHQQEVKRLTGWGFACLRSPRFGDGHFWELWFLPGLWSAKGDLAEAISNKKLKTEKAKSAAAIEFIRVRASFGTLDVSTQRLAQRIPD
jgi:hypothetical protein